MGAAVVGMYRNSPLYLDTSAAATKPSEPAKSTTPSWSAWRPAPEPVAL